VSLPRDRLWFGGDYNPEQWPEPVWAQDAVLMRAARVNAVTVGVFSWSLAEPEEGRYDFGWLDAVLERLHTDGVRVILATPTASPPPWFTLAHPGAMPVTREGTTLAHGSRDTYCVAAPAYRRAAARITGELARRYGHHPAVALWHVHNEYGTYCWCDHAARRFRCWLRQRYGPGAAGLAALNEAWGTTFWSQRYSAWEQVLPPRATQWLPNPSHALDYHRFWSDEMLAAFCEQRDQIRRHSPGVPVTTNYILPSYQLIDEWAWSAQTDVVAVDHYLSEPGPAGAADVAFCGDRARSWGGGRPWLLMEQSTSLIYASDRMLIKEPGQMLRDSLGYLARGSDSVLFFQWRASPAGAEMHHPAMVPHAGPDTRVFREVSALGRAVERLGEIAGSVVAAGAALMWDPCSAWALEHTRYTSVDLRYQDAVRDAHAALWRAGVVCDFIRPDGQLGRYPLVLVPATYVMTGEAAAALRSYVAGGGHVVMWYFSAVVDGRHHAWLGGAPGDLCEVFGIRVEEHCPLPAAPPVGLAWADGWDSGTAGALGTVWSERLAPGGADVLARYAGGPLDGCPAVTRHAFGAGSAWYVSTRLAGPAQDRLVAGVLAAAGAGPAVPGLPPGAEAVRRRAPGRSWLFVLNHGERTACVPASGVELLTGRRVDGELAVEPQGAAVLREEP
jgi:beta-galactosidase